MKPSSPPGVSTADPRRRPPDPAPANPRDGEPDSVRYRVEGLCCASEVRQIEASLGTDPRVRSLRFDPVRSLMDVSGDIPPAAVRDAIGSLGMEARRADEEEGEATAWEQNRRLVLAVTSGAFFAATLVAQYLVGAETASVVLAVASVVTGGWFVFPRGARAALNRALDMNFLMSVAALGALAIGEHAEAASVMFLFAVAQLLETRSMERARGAIRSLMELAPDVARLVVGGREELVPAARVRPGDVVAVRPGEKIPVDGRVTEGRSSVDQAPITGESMPVDVEPGTTVFAGTLNGEGALEVRSVAPASASTLARIIHAVEEAQATRAPSQTFVDRFARVYTPAVVATAVALAMIPPLLGVGAWGEWFYRALALLVVACPCALVISTPVTVVSALAGAARQGILIKGGLHLENAGRVRVVALDKTGTLTLGRPQVVSVTSLDARDGDRVLALAAGAESRSEHPLAGAILRHAAEVGVEPAAASGTRALAGLGVEATVDGTTVLVGNPRLFAERGAGGPDLDEAVTVLEGRGHTVVLVGTLAAPDAVPEVVGLLALADQVRPGAAEGLATLHRAGIERVVMLTGDNDASARSVAAALDGGVDEVRAGLLPADKVAALRTLRSARGGVLMVGDGINDAPALAAADVGVAMGAAGTDVALETADIALMTDDIEKLGVLIALSRRAEGIIRANIVFALAVKAVFVVLAATGVATLWMAVAADMGASLAVIANGLRALRVKA